MPPALQREDVLLLHLLEPLDPLFFDDFLERFFFPGLDGNVRVKKGHGKGFCQQDPQGALPRAGHADQDDVSLFFHWSYPFGPDWKVTRFVILSPTAMRKRVCRSRFPGGPWPPGHSRKRWIARAGKL